MEGVTGKDQSWEGVPAGVKKPKAKDEKGKVEEEREREEGGNNLPDDIQTRFELGEEIGATAAVDLSLLADGHADSWAR